MTYFMVLNTVEFTSRNTLDGTVLCSYLHKALADVNICFCWQRNVRTSLIQKAFPSSLE